MLCCSGRLDVLSSSACISVPLHSVLCVAQCRSQASHVLHRALFCCRLSLPPWLALGFRSASDHAAMLRLGPPKL